MLRRLRGVVFTISSSLSLSRACLFSHTHFARFALALVRRRSLRRMIALRELLSASIDLAQRGGEVIRAVQRSGELSIVNKDAAIGGDGAFPRFAFAFFAVCRQVCRVPSYQTITSPLVHRPSHAC